MVDYLKRKKEKIALSCDLDYLSHLSTTLNTILYLFRKGTSKKEKLFFISEVQQTHSRELVVELSPA